jgi:iron(III) transport system permease protein
MPRALAALLALALVAVLGWPLAATLISTVDPGSDAALGGGGLITATAFADEVGPAIQTNKVVLGAVAVALPPGLVLAALLFKTDAAGRRGLVVLLATGLFLPMPLHAAGWLGSYGNAGRSQALGGFEPILSGWLGAAWVHGMAAVPWVALIVGAALRGVEPELEQSALLDRPGWWIVLRVSLRRCLGAIAGAALAVAVLTAGDMTVTDLLQVRTYAEEAYVQYGLGRPPAEVGRVAIPPTVVLGALVAAGAILLGKAEPSRVASARSGWVLPLGRARWGAGLVAAGLLVLIDGLPLYGLLWRAGRVGGMVFLEEGPGWSLSGLGTTLRLAVDEVAGPLGTSAVWGAVAATAATAAAWGLAWACRSSRWGVWPAVVVGSCALMLAAPGPVAGMALVLAYRDVPPVYDTAAIVVIGLILRTLPFALLILWPAVRAIPETFLETAEVDGLGRWGLIGRVGLPLTAGPAVAAWGVAFVLALGELPVTNLVYPPGLSPLSVVVWGLLHTGVESHLAGVGLVLLLVHGLAGLAAVAGVGWAMGSGSDRP